MVRSIVFFIIFSFFSVECIAQKLENEPTEAVLNSAIPARTNRRARSLAVANARVSIVRLREPLKARRLYEKALKAWIHEKPTEAQRGLDQALKVYPTFPEALTLSGGIQGALQQWARAEQSLQAAIQSDSHYSPAYIVLAGIYNAQARFDEAWVAAQQALSAGADNWELQYEIVRALIGKQEYESALAITEGALRLNDHGSLLHLAKPHALLGLRRYPQAATELSVYLRDEPSGEGSQDARDLLQQVQTILSR